MNAYLTYGTEYFLNQLIKKHPEREIFKLYGDDSVYLYEETNEKSIFSSPKKYDIVDAVHLFLNQPVMLQYFNVKTERQSLFDQLRITKEQLEAYEGFVSYRLLKPLEGETYIALFQFTSRALAEDFRKSSIFTENFANEALKRYASEDFTTALYYSKYLSIENNNNEYIKEDET